MNMAEGVGQSRAVSEENTQPVADPKCVFCRIVAKQEPASIVYEDENYLCFRDKSPAATHHYLLVPKTHIRHAINRAQIMSSSRDYSGAHIDL